MEPFEELEEDYQTDARLTPEQNTAFKNVHRRHRYLLSLYYKVVEQMNVMREENRILKEKYNERFNKIEETQRSQGKDLTRIIELAEKIDNKLDNDADWFRKAVFGGMITLAAGLAVGLIMFAVNN